MIDILKQEEIAQHIGNLILRIRALERSVKLGQRTEELDSGQFETDGNPQESRFIFYPSFVTSIFDATTVIAERAKPDATTPWIVDPDFSTRPLSITIPENLTAPEVGDLVGAFFTGTYSLASGTEGRYTVFGSVGGGARRGRLIEESDDWLRLVEMTKAGTDVGTVTVAKQQYFQRTPFDGNTINGVTYVYSGPNVRLATNANTPAIVAIEKIIPSYVTSFVEVQFLRTTGTGVTEITSTTSLGTPIFGDVLFVDITVGRVWAKISVP